MKKSYVQRLSTAVAVRLDAPILFVLLHFTSIANAQTAVSLSKQNVLYIGVNNPLTIAAFDTPDDSLEVYSKKFGVSITKNGKGRYTTRVASPGEAIIFVKNNKKQTTDSLQFRVKRIPDPVTVLGCGNESSGMISLARFRAETGINIKFHTDFDASCEIHGFEMTLSKRNGEIITAQIAGSAFDKAAKNLQAQAESGDIVFFDNIKVRCPGDYSGRKINNMVWRIR